MKFNIKTSKSVVFRTLKAKEELKEIRMDSKAIKNRKYMMNKGRLEFEKVLDRNLRTKFVKRKVNDIGRNTFSSKNHAGRLIGTDK